MIYEYIKTLSVPIPLTETESENEFRPLDERIDEFHPKATRTLFIGNLEKTTTYHDLRNIFQRFGEIVVCFVLFCFFTIKTVLDLCHKTQSIAEIIFGKTILRSCNECFSHLPYVFFF